MKFYKSVLPLFRMKKWSGGLLIIALVVILISSYSLIGTPPQKKQPVPDSSVLKDGTSPVVSPPLGEKRFVKSPKKSKLANVEGLHDLYAPSNISKDQTKPLLVWPHMRLLLSRADALAETSQGVKEASVAWKGLLSTIEEDKASKLNNTDKLESENCPYSVSSTDTTISGSRSILELPCGLVEGSSITVVAIPDGGNQTFQIELASSQSLDEPNPSIILHYSVSLPGENMTEEPFIVQNTWTNKDGWGKKERCPSSVSVNTSTVDALVLCNEQGFRGTLEYTTNTSQPINDASVHVSHGTSHGSSNFPFVEGNPFTATLWVGLEGFHMTVNGRHETSFAYREKLEPWLASGVKVAGGLEVLSALAKGLPVSEDHDLIVDADHLKAPPVKRKRITMLVGVFSTGNNFERRMALRRSWMQYEAVRSGDVAVRFFIGLHKNRQVNFELWKEAQAYGDIQFMPFVDYYSLISLKTIAICIMGTKILPAKYVMKTDDDAFVRIDEVLTSLKAKPPDGLLYGFISFESSPHRDKDSKWYINSEEWPHDSYPPWAHGPGYIISQDIAKYIVQGHHERELKLFKLEDVAMGIWIQQFKNSGKEVHYINDERFFNAGCEKNYILAHYQSPRLVLCLWEKLQKDHQPVCCE
ncbi:hypothetical protein K2173_022291 [Erythroxylum novogranatense]|uniref:Galectin domain-containing protein n=1 Tax=Erythroxylum novogranatense TaxID=1862640 RepID=A0AAV8THD9_9ROSI|nr:hypothetical protein K2173_022291 [Erythroxylum novogranatense]